MSRASSGLGSVLLTMVAASASVAQQPDWCRATPPPTPGRYAACGQGGSIAEADREAFAGIARQLRASVVDTLRAARHVFTEGMAGGPQLATLTDTSAAWTEVASDALLRNVRVERRTLVKKSHYALAVLDLSRELADVEELVGEAGDSLEAGRIASALSLCRQALLMLDDSPLSAVGETEGRACRLMPDQIDRTLSIDLPDSDHATVRMARVPVAGVQLVLRRTATNRLRLSAPTDRRGVAVLPSAVGYVGGGPVTEEIDLDWSGLGPLAATIPFRPRAVRSFTTRGVSVAVSVTGGLSASDRLALAAAVNRELRNLGFTVPGNSKSGTWTLAIDCETRDAPASLGDLPTASATLRWQVFASDSLWLGQGGATDVRGIGTDQAAARTAALERAAEALTADLETLTARRAP